MIGNVILITMDLRQESRRWIVSLRRALASIVLLAVMLSGCSILYPTPDAAMWEPLPTVQVEATTAALPTATATESLPATVTPVLDPTSLAQETAAKAAWARDVIWAYLVRALEDSDLPATPTWTVSKATQTDDATRYRYLADPWTVTISVPTGPLNEVVCEATLAGPAAFGWTARVDTQGNVQGEDMPAYVTPAPQVTATLTVTAPLTVTVLPTATLTPAATETPILTPTAALTSTVAPMKTATPTKKSPRTSTPAPTQTSAATQTAAPTQTPAPTGTAAPAQTAAPTQTSAPTYTSAVTPPPAATPVPASELVEGWVGQISTLDAGVRYDDYFLVDGTGARYGIASLVPRIAEELASYRDTGTRLRVWGILDYGVEDYGSRRIVVGRYEIAY